MVISKKPGPEGAAMAQPHGVIFVIKLITDVQVSGVRCQQPNMTRWTET
jgi:hypothetical protein